MTETYARSAITSVLSVHQAVQTGVGGPELSEGELAGFDFLFRLVVVRQHDVPGSRRNESLQRGVVRTGGKLRRGISKE